MKLLRLDLHLLAVLDEALAGRLGDAIAEVVREGHEPELRGVRQRMAEGPSRWGLRCGTRTFPIDPTDRVALAVVVHLHVADLVDEVRRDVALNFKNADPEDGLDSLVPWPSAKGDGAPS